MRALSFNTVAKNLKAAFYGMNGNQFVPVEVDGDGRIVLSSPGAIQVTAADLDIRALDSAIDSVTATASDLGIRALSGATDSIQNGERAFVSDFSNESVALGTNNIAVKNIAPYSQNSYFVRNVSGSTVTITVQVAPVNVDSYYINVATATLAVSSNYFVAITVPAAFSRLSVAALASGLVQVYYEGRA